MEHEDRIGSIVIIITIWYME